MVDCPVRVCQGHRKCLEGSHLDGNVLREGWHVSGTVEESVRLQHPHGDTVTAAKTPSQMSLHTQTAASELSASPFQATGPCLDTGVFQN